MLKGDYMKRSKEELQQDHIDQLYTNISKINNLLHKYPSLVQPKFIIEYFKDKKTNSVLCYQYASFIRDCYGHINKSKTNSFTRSVMGKKNSSFDVPYSFGDYLCLKRDKMFSIIKQGFFDVEKNNQINSLSINQRFHLDLFDPETRSRTKANMKCKQMLLRKKKNRSKDEVPEEEMFAFAVNQFYIKTFGWQSGIIVSQLLYWILKNKRETVFFSDSELSIMLYMDRKNIRASKIWNQDFITKEPSGKKFKIRIDLEKLIVFMKREMKQ